MRKYDSTGVAESARVTMGEWEYLDCAICDPYRWRGMPEGMVMPVCWNHRTEREMRVPRNLPLGSATSWRRGTWA
jgi:hypothetical protein